MDETPDAAAIARYGVRQPFYLYSLYACELIFLQNYHHTLNSLAGHVVNLCLSHHDQLRYNAVHILYCMIVSEFHVSGHFDNIENELVSKLDSLFMSDNKGDDVTRISRALFIGSLRQLFEASEVDADLRTRVTTFLDAVDIFLELLLNVRALPEGEEFADDRVIATVSTLLLRPSSVE